MKTIVFLVFSIFATIYSSYAQPFPQGYFRSPLDIPLQLAGNYGEIRPNHFHAGLDFKTNGVVGKSVYAVADGFVSRISVSPTGYGKAVYIDHPNGYTTVYGHLASFSKEIESLIVAEQYKQQKFKVNFYPKATDVEVRKGAVIGLSGNTGGSGGPHLHFEIRDSESEYVYNPFLFGLPIVDDTPPKIFKLLVYPQDELSVVNGKQGQASINVNPVGDGYSLSQTLRLRGKIGFGIQAHDYINGSSNRCGIFSIVVTVDGEVVHASKIVEHSFEESRYINAHVDYPALIGSYTKIHKCFILPNNQLRIYERKYGDGVVNVTKSCAVKIDVLDAYGNKSVLEFTAELDKTVAQVSRHKLISKPDLKKYATVNYITDEDVSVVFPENSFYRDIDLTWSKSENRNYLSKLIVLHTESEPLHKKIFLGIRPDNATSFEKDKVCAVRINGGRRSAYMGDWNKGFFTIETNKFGNYALTTDETPPNISVISAMDASAFEGKALVFKLSDNLSGVDTINPFVNGQWILYEWDAKTALLTIEIPEEYRTKSIMNFSLQVFDYLGNKAEFSKSFIR